MEETGFSPKGNSAATIWPTSAGRGLLHFFLITLLCVFNVPKSAEACSLCTCSVGSFSTRYTAFLSEQNSCLMWSDLSVFSIMVIAFCALFKNNRFASRSPWLLPMVFLLLAMFCLLYLPQVLQDSAQGHLLPLQKPSPTSRRPPNRCLSPCSQSPVLMPRSQLLLH